MSHNFPSPRSQHDHCDPSLVGNQVMAFDVSSRRAPAQRTRIQVAVRPKTARTVDSARREKLPNSRDIERLKQELNAKRPRPIQWRDTDPSFNQDLVSDHIANSRDEQRPRYIMAGPDPIDIYAPPQPTRLISTTASVQDYIGVPNSLSFIR
jgi:hypothetical protein